MEKNLSASGGNLMRCEFDPWVRKIPWRKKWQTPPVSLPEECLWTEEPVGLQSMGSQSIKHN